MLIESFVSCRGGNWLGSVGTQKSAVLPYFLPGPRKPIYPYGEPALIAHTPTGYIVLVKILSSSRFGRKIEQS